MSLPDLPLIKSDVLPPRRRLSDDLTGILVERIRSGQYVAGSRLPSTRKLAEEFNVSPPIIREALSRLKHDGYVEPRQGSGVYVRSVTAVHSFRFDTEEPGRGEMLADIFEMRLHVEKACAELAALRRSDADLAVLRRHLDAMEEAVSKGEDGTVSDVEFHLTVANATRNEAMRQLAGFLYGSLSEAVATARASSRRQPGRSRLAQEEHAAIFEAIASGDSARAGAAMEHHLAEAARRLGLERGGAVMTRGRD